MRSQASLAASAIPPSQNTAPVLEFRCLYTHDIRRKAKRWQDGFLRFHTFNKRVMVYDVPRNFIGDMHWWESEELQDGDEMTLEKGGVLVQVGEPVGVTETDLTPLFERRNNGTPEKGRKQAVTMPAAPSGRNDAAVVPSQLKHKSLNTLLGTPKRAYGRAALPVKSPYEERYGLSENDWENGREAKRQRIGNISSSSARNVVKPLRTLKAAMDREAPLRARTADAHSDGAPNTKGLSHTHSMMNQTSPPARLTIEISSDTEDVSSDTALRVTPSNTTNPILPPSRTVPARRHAMPLPLPASTANRQINNQAKSKPPSLDKENRCSESRDGQADAANPRAKILRSVAPAPRRMLLCQNTTNQKDATKPNNVKSPADMQRIEEIKDRPVSRQGARQREVSLSKPKDNPAEETVEGRTRVEKVTTACRTSSSPDAFEVMEAPSENSRSRATRGGTLDKPGKSAEPVRKPINGLDRLSRKTTAKVQEKAAEASASLEAMVLDHGRMDQRLLTSKATSHGRPADHRLHSLAKTSEARPFRRVRSENDTMTLPEAAVGGGSAGSVTTEQVTDPSRRRALAFKSQFQRSRSLNIPPPTKTVVVPATAKKEKESALPEVLKDMDIGPWSTEAFDLFDWRPPDRDVNGKKVGPHEGTANAQAEQLPDIA